MLGFSSLSLFQSFTFCTFSYWISFYANNTGVYIYIYICMRMLSRDGNIMWSHSKVNTISVLLFRRFCSTTATRRRCRETYPPRMENIQDFWPTMHCKERSSWHASFHQVGGSVSAGPGGPSLSTATPDLHGRLISEKRLEQGSGIWDRSAGPARGFFSFIYLGGHVARGVFGVMVRGR